MPRDGVQNNVALGTFDAVSNVAGSQRTDNEARWEIEAWDISRYRIANVCPFGTNGFSLPSTPTTPARPAASAAFVTKQYQDILGREPDNNGRNFWEAQVMNGEFKSSESCQRAHGRWDQLELDDEHP